MTCLRRVLAALVFGTFSMFSVKVPAEPPPAEPIADVVARVQHSVVRIVVVRAADKPVAENTSIARAADDKPATSIGSGFVIDTGDLVATNRHVVENAASIFVGTADGGRFPADLVGMPGKADIALLRIHPATKLPALTLGDSDKLRVGDTVIAIGSPFGFDNTVTAGIVSGVNRDIMESPFDDYIQTDAAINHGNSGGPLFDMSGKVVGMNSVLFAPGTYSGSVGVGFALPSNELRFVFDRLEKYGVVNGGMLPIRTQQLTALMAQAIGAPGAGGALIVSMQAQSDLMNGQIVPGDVISTFNGEPVTDPRDLARKAAMAEIGSRAILGICRSGKIMSVDVPILPFDPSAQPRDDTYHRPTQLGLTLALRTGAAGSGVTVSAIDPTGSVADSGLQTGDVILRVQQQVISTPDEAMRALQARSEAKQPYAAMLIERDNSQSWLPVGLP